jgi:hypothetical protein
MLNGVSEGIRTFTGREKWDFTSIIKILKNEKYKGGQKGWQETTVIPARASRSNLAEQI